MRVTWLWARSPDDEPGTARSVPQGRSSARGAPHDSIASSDGNRTTTPQHHRPTERTRPHV